MIKIYSLAKDGNTQLSDNFKVYEFRCKDGSDEIKIDTDLVMLLQKIRDCTDAPISITSAYRNVVYNKSIGGAVNSQHMYGTAADIQVKGYTPLQIAQLAEALQPNKGGTGLYNDFTHVDVRTAKSRWDSTSGKEIVVAGFLGNTIDLERGKESEMKKIEFVGEGKEIRAFVDGKEIGAGMLIEYNGKTNCLGIADFLRELGHEVSWKKE